MKLSKPTQYTHTVRAWVKTLPTAPFSCPSGSLACRVRHVFWRVYTPLHPPIREVLSLLGARRVLRALRVISHGPRQDFLVGHIAETHTFETVILRLIDEGFGTHCIAWRDRGEVASLRKVVGFEFQYHVRIFADGEVRGHYEYTPEYRPWHHLRQIGQEDCREEFMELLKDHLVPVRVP